MAVFSNGVPTLAYGPSGSGIDRGAQPSLQLGAGGVLCLSGCSLGCPAEEVTFRQDCTPVEGGGCTCTEVRCTVDCVAGRMVPRSCEVPAGGPTYFPICPEPGPGS